MLIKIEELQSYSLDSLDGEIGKVKEFYFDDRYWSIRYLVADTGHWLKERQILLSPHALVAVDKEAQNIVVNLAKQQIEDSPSLNSDMPVSRQFEAKYFEYYQWPMYWVGPHMWGVNPDIRRSDEKNQSELTVAEEWNANLRSTSAVSGYYIHAQDGEIGHVDDFIIDDDTWSIRYLVINTSNWWLGKKVLIAPSWIESVNWDTSEVYINMSREIIKHAPEYTDWSILTREFEDCLHRHYESQGFQAARNDA